MATLKLRNIFIAQLSAHGQTMYNIKLNRENSVERNMSDIRFRIYANHTR